MVSALPTQSLRTGGLLCKNRLELFYGLAELHFILIKLNSLFKLLSCLELKKETTINIRKTLMSRFQDGGSNLTFSAMEMAGMR
jgi:hypothetical protein